MEAARIAVKGTINSGKTVTCSIGDSFTLRAMGKRPEGPDDDYDFTIAMGGFVTFLAATREKRIKAAVPIIGTPDLELLEKWPDSSPPMKKPNSN